MRNERNDGVVTRQGNPWSPAGVDKLYKYLKMNFWEEFTEEKKAAIKRAIEVAEMQTSGEIRVHIEDHCKKNVFDRAVDIFARLKMHKTALRTGILFYTVVADRKFVVIGDAGINKEVPEDFWNHIRERVLSFFKEDQITEGLMEGIRMAGEQLAACFPRQEGDVNELSNEISYGETE